MRGSNRRVCNLLMIKLGNFQVILQSNRQKHTTNDIIPFYGGNKSKILDIKNITEFSSCMYISILIRIILIASTSVTQLTLQLNSSNKSLLSLLSFLLILHSFTSGLIVVPCKNMNIFIVDHNQLSKPYNNQRSSTLRYQIKFSG